MTCPDPECHDNVSELRKSIKCLPKKVGRAELWSGICFVLVMLVPMSFAYMGKTTERITIVEKDIVAIKEQQKKMESVVYNAVKQAIKDINDERK